MPVVPLQMMKVLDAEGVGETVGDDNRTAAHDSASGTELNPDVEGPQAASSGSSTTAVTVSISERLVTLCTQSFRTYITT
jgi:hypothetical protein